jgi:aspartate ammonia-lyase
MDGAKFAPSHERGKAMRIEKDFLGPVEVPDEAYYGIETVRTAQSFPISGLRADPAMIEAVMFIKKAAALVHSELGRLEPAKANAIAQACDEVLIGGLRDQFIIDVFQMGAGTSFHMNCNEVLANRAEEILCGRKGEYRIVRPHDDVNLGQSTNDVYPTAMRIAALSLLRDQLSGALSDLEQAFRAKAVEFDAIVKSGRTHLRDAAPVRLGQEFRAYGVVLNKCGAFLQAASRSLRELGIGGTAVGTGLSAAPGYAEMMVHRLSAMTGFDFVSADDLGEAMQSLRPMAEVSGALRNLALEMTRISNDLRLLASGPETGFGEIRLPPVAPGSSIMPGKVNPSMAEMMNMVCYQVIGCDLAVSGAVQAGQLELNVMMPVVSFNLLFMIRIMANALTQLKSRSIEGITADAERCRTYALRSPALAIALSLQLGYGRAAEIARKAVEAGKTIPEIVEEEGILSPEESRRVFDLLRMTGT